MLQNINFKFLGKYADIANALKKAKVVSHFWKILCIAPIIGVLEGRTSSNGKSSEESATVFSEQMNDYYDEIIFAFRIVMLLNPVKTLDEKKEDAFKYYCKVDDEEKNKRVKDNFDLFKAYLFGGLDVLYEELLEGNIDNNNNIKDREEYFRKSSKYIKKLCKSEEIIKLNENLF